MKPMEVFLAMQETDSKEESIAILRTERDGTLIRTLQIAERENKICHFCSTDQGVKYVVETFDPVINANGKSHVCCCNECLIKLGRNSE